MWGHMKFLYMDENMDKILNKFEEINQQFSLINLNTDIKYYDKWCFKEKYINVKRVYSIFNNDYLNIFHHDFKYK